MSDEILCIDIDEYKSNADLITAAAQMGYLKGRVLDMTYGQGLFWSKFRPMELWRNDLYVEGLDSQCDFRHFHPSWSNSFDTSVFDPPYKLDGTPGEEGPAEANKLYGVARGDRGYESVSELEQLYYDGLEEAFRVTKPKGFILVKCMDQVSGGKTRWFSRLVANFSEEWDGRHVTSFFLVGMRKQPALGKTQRNPRNNYSQLMVLQKGRR